MASMDGMRVGDRVMQIVNNYDEAVINGDIGYVVASDAKDVLVEFDDPALELAVAAGRFRGRQQSADGSPMPLLPYEQEAVSTPALSGAVTLVWLVVERCVRVCGMQATRVVVKYSKSEARRQLRLAYATTVHKAQGNEWPVVVVVAHQSHYVMLTRGLLYTALSRAQNLCVVVATKKVRTCVCVCVWLCGCACVCGCVCMQPLSVSPHVAVLAGSGYRCTRNQGPATTHLPCAATD